jgi:hypothetical protein
MKSEMAVTQSMPLADVPPAANAASGVLATIHEVVPPLLLGAVAIVFAPLLHTVSPVLAIAIQSLIACAIALLLPGYTTAIAIFTLLFQNIVVSIMAPIIAGPSELEFIKGYNFLCCAVMWAVVVIANLIRWRTLPPAIVRLMLAGAAVTAVIGVYFVVGLLQDPMSAVIYLRNVIFPVLIFQLALLTAATHPARLTRILVAIGVLMIVCGYVEFFFRDIWLDLTNGHAYWRFEEIKATDSGIWEKEMRATGSVPVDLKDRFKFSFLNTPLLDGLGFDEFLRVFGPNISAISYAYGLAFFILFMCATKRYLFAALAIPLAIVCGVKGALIMTLFVIAGWLGTLMIGAFWTLVAGVVAALVYAAVGLYVGLQIGDYHVIGFMGGLNGFLQWPLGRGLGIGGNLGGDFTSIDWSAAQSAGAVDGAVESAVGVLIYQMGIGAIVPLSYYAAIALLTWQRYRQSMMLPQGLAAFGILITLINGIFQEEALFAPLALGTLLALAGLVLGNAIRADWNRAIAAGAGAVEPKP